MNFFNIKYFKLGLPFLLILGGIAFFSIQIYLVNKPAILYKYKDKAAVDPSDGLFVIFNPFRDKEPEIRAEKFLDNLMRGSCEQLKSEVKIDCERENKDSLALESWKIIDREEINNQVKLHYNVNRQIYQNAYGNVWITLQKESGNWKVIDYESWY